MNQRQLKGTLRQMLAALDGERQALAGLDLDGILGAANDKERLADLLADAPSGVIDEECRSLVEAARRMNEVNRQIRNLVAANVAARLDALTGRTPLYGTGGRYAVAGRRG